MQNFALGLLSVLMLYSKPILADSLNDNKSYNAIRVEHGNTILLQYRSDVYGVYAARCNEVIKDDTKLNYIILNPGEPIELLYESKNDIKILILYSLPCK